MGTETTVIPMWMGTINVTKMTTVKVSRREIKRLKGHYYVRYTKQEIKVI